MRPPAYPPTVFVLGTSRNIGKTVTCIGIIAKLTAPESGYTVDDIGYIKPVGQQTLTVLSGEGVPIEADKDAVLITSLMNIQCHGYEKTSPVVWRGGLTSKYIEEAAQGDPLEGRQEFLERIREAYEQVALGKKIVIVEGTGQPGVGSVAGISNADVINTLREMGVPLFAILVTRAGIGSTIDEVFPYLMALDHLGTRIDGLIINAVIPSKMHKVRHYLETYYTQVFQSLYGRYLKVQTPPQILGFVPEIPELELPTMRLIVEYFAKKPESAMEIIAPEDFTGACRLVRNLKVISLEFGYEPFLEPGDAVIVGVNANDVILAVLLIHERLLRKHGQGLAGLILSCKQVGEVSPQIRELLLAGDLPTITLNYDSADIVQRIESMTVKIQPYDVGKRELISRVYRRHLTLWPELQPASQGSV
ncbi:MAG: AAA family ATPase [Anaerolineae bacterium]|nr:AAA family ATPase [Anaerolineae bacterium]